jgi:hypothetical protein
LGETTGLSQYFARFLSPPKVPGSVEADASDQIIFLNAKQVFLEDAKYIISERLKTGLPLFQLFYFFLTSHSY